MDMFISRTRINRVKISFQKLIFQACTDIRLSVYFYANPNLSLETSANSTKSVCQYLNTSRVQYLCMLFAVVLSRNSNTMEEQQGRVEQPEEEEEDVAGHDGRRDGF